MKNEIKENENATVTDEALKDVSGGVNYIEFDSVGATFQMGESRVRVINGKSCPSCGGTIGKIMLGPLASAVTCEKCNTIILNSYTDKEIEII